LFLLVVCSLVNGESDLFALAITLLVNLGVGFPLWWLYRKDYLLGVKDGILIAVFGDIGPSENYAFISDTGKWFLAWNMLVGHLEMFSALVFLYPSFWKQ